MVLQTVMTAQTSSLAPPPRRFYYVQDTKCCSSKFLFMSYLHNAAFGFNKKLDPCLCSISQAMLSVSISRWTKWSISSMADGNKSDLPVSADGQTRLVGAIQAFQKRLRNRVMELRKGLLMKILFFLFGFYCATAFATVIGQTGDWDILSAGLAVFVVEGIGALMYRASFKFMDKIRGWIVVFNYWKAGLSLGLFLDAFKY